MVIFLVRDCYFLRTSGLFQNLGRDSNFYDVIATFLGQVGNSVTWDELVIF